MRVKLPWRAIGPLVVVALVATGCATSSGPPDPRTQSVSWANSQDFGENAMHVIVTSDAPVDRRIVTNITRSADGQFVCASESTSVYDPDEMGEPGSPLTTDETSLSLNTHPSGTGFTIQTQFFDALDNVTATKVTAWTKP